jgi:hypothetical protein
MSILLHYIRTCCLSLYGGVLFRMTTGYFLIEIIKLNKYPKYTWKWCLGKSLLDFSTLVGCVYVPGQLNKYI